MRLRKKSFLILFVVFSFMTQGCDNIRDTMGASASALSGDSQYNSQSANKSLNDFADSSGEVDNKDLSNNEDANNSSFEKKLIKEARVSFEVKSLKTARKQILKSVKKFKAYVSLDSEHKGYHRIRNEIIVRIPIKNFDSLLSEITKGVKRFDEKVITVKDVTKEFLDTKARIKTKKDLEKRYLEVLKVANSVKDILEVEKQIGSLRTDIERIEGQFKYLKDKISFSTLNITIYENLPAPKIEKEEKGYLSLFQKGFSSGLENFILFFVFLANIWPIVLFLVAVLFIIRRKRKKKLAKKNNAEEVLDDTKESDTKEKIEKEN